MIRVASDLHTEFHADQGLTVARELTDGLDSTDVLVLAGDIAAASGIGEVLALFAKQTAASIVFVTGNHEFYGGDRAGVLASIQAAERAHPNLHWLDHTVVTIGGQRFLGTPLWFRQDPRAPKWAMNDFVAIRGFENWVYTENRRALDFLRAELQAGDVVVSHHLPAEASVVARYRGSPLNAFFVCDVSPLIREREPALWIHGHTHDSLDYRLGATRVVCNPFGYAPSDLNHAFRIRDLDLTQSR